MRTRYVDGFRRRPLLAIGFSAIAVASMVTVLLQAPTPGQNPRIPTVHAAAKPVAPIEPRGVIDGAKNPELIPDDQAYHLVLMVASAADDAPEVEKARVDAVRAMILRLGGLPGDDVPELAEVANHHRKTLTGLIAEAKRGSADAERLKSELLGRVKAEADLRLPAAVRKALADYVKVEKANMKIHGKPDPQVVALPKLLEPGTGFTALGYCDNDAGSLAPYCRDGCSGSRPCDKKCRRDDESCTTCGQYGVCCCLGGGGGGTPTPTPPPSSQMTTSEPTGSVYRNITISDDGVMFATAITDTAASCSCHSSSASAWIRAPWGTRSSSTGVTGPYAQSTAQYQMSEAEFSVERDVIVETEHTSFCPIRNIQFIYARPTNLIPVRWFSVPYIFSWSESNPPYDAHTAESIDGYDASFCPSGFCASGNFIRKEKHGAGLGHGWVQWQGFQARLPPFGIRICYGHPYGRPAKPPCNDPA